MKRKFIFFILILIGSFPVFAEFDVYTSPSIGFSQGINIGIPENSKKIDLENMTHFLTLSSTAGVIVRGTHNSGWGVVGVLNYQLMPYIHLKSPEEENKYFGISLGFDSAAMPAYTFYINENCDLTLACGFSFCISLSMLTDSKTLVKKGGILKELFGGAFYIGMDYTITDSIAINFSLSDLLGRNIDFFFINNSPSLFGLSNIFQVNIGITFRRSLTPSLF